MAWQLTGNFDGVVNNREWVGHSEIEGYTQLALLGQIGWQTTINQTSLTIGGQTQLAFANQPVFRPWLILASDQYLLNLKLGSLRPLNLHHSVFDQARNWPSRQANPSPVWQEGLQLGYQGETTDWQTQVLWRTIERQNQAEYFDVLQRATWQVNQQISLLFEHHLAHQGGQITYDTSSLRAQSLRLGSLWQKNHWSLGASMLASQVGDDWGQGGLFGLAWTNQAHTIEAEVFVGDNYAAVSASELYQLPNLSTASWHWQIDDDLSFGLALQMSDRLLFTSQLLYWHIHF
ncbi:hypothetical protein [Salinibius halmophilus]|uniref:hypothetical protein n=1 Tax=Salinibius halmophilus TaxID=1853216 RepID=UPI000E66F99F|nr:hypothetical protein [Salinibius halmophilus]